jgi:hypothetical protein
MVGYAAQVGDMKLTQNLSEHLNGREHMEDLGIDEWIVMKQV